MAINKTAKRLYASQMLAVSKTSWPPQELLTSNAHKTTCSPYANELVLKTAGKVYKRRESLILISVLFSMFI